MTVQREFLDSNVLCYTFSDDRRKASIALDLLAKEGGVISVQVLNETCRVAIKKTAMAWPEVENLMLGFENLLEVQALSLETQRLARKMAAKYRWSIYDASIVASALLADCTILWTEDLHSGQVIEGRLTVKNPFVDA